MDISFKTDYGKFSFRVSAVIVNENKLLIMKDSNIDGWYLPGGRVHAGECVEEAIDREMLEELLIPLRVIRPLWFKQAFFTTYYSNEKMHEISVYFLIDGNNDELLKRGETFTLFEQGECAHTFKWIDFDSLKDEFFNPPFLKTAIFDLPQNLTLLTVKD